MKYENVIKGKFVARPNRFIATVTVDGKEEKAHVKNTGRCRELLVPGAQVYLEDHMGRMGKRKLRYSLIGVKKGCEDVNMDSQAPNRVVKEALTDGRLKLSGMSKPVIIKSEYKYGDSRLDFYVEDGAGRRGLIEVKGVTLECNGTAKFPDAPTERGVKHINELIGAADDGYLAYIIFVIQMKGVRELEPNDETHRAFGDALRDANEKGVNIMAVDCVVTSDSLGIDGRIPVKL